MIGRLSFCFCYYGKWALAEVPFLFCFYFLPHLNCTSPLPQFRRLPRRFPRRIAWKWPVFDKKNRRFFFRKLDKKNHKDLRGKITREATVPTELETFSKKWSQGRSLSFLRQKSWFFLVDLLWTTRIRLSIDEVNAFFPLLFSERGAYFGGIFQKKQKNALIFLSIII